VPRTRNRKEVYALVGLLLVFLVFATYSERIGQEFTSVRTPSSFNAGMGGLKALYLLLESQHYPVTRLRSPWNALGSKDGLLLIAEPLNRDRPIQPVEINVLKRWVEAGGTVLYLVDAPARPFDSKDTLFGDVSVREIDSAPRQTILAKTDSPYLRDVATLSYNSRVRLRPIQNAAYTTLVKDEAGALLLHKSVGKGHALIGALSSIASNKFIRENDNALLLINIAYVASGAAQKTVVFDEYHHGVGFLQIAPSGVSYLTVTPRAVLFSFFHLVLLCLFVVYNGNRRFGKTLSTPIPAHRPSTDYVGAMARLFQRAGASEIAMQTLYRQFIRDLARHLDMPPESERAILVQRAAQQDGIPPGELHQLLSSCEAATKARISETDLRQLAVQIETFRRQYKLVG
jgi:hypothetical protein